MGLFDSVKNIFTIPEEDDYEEEFEQAAEKEEPKKNIQYNEQPVKKAETAPRIIGGKSRTVSFNQSQMQVVLVKDS